MRRALAFLLVFVAAAAVAGPCRTAHAEDDLRLEVALESKQVFLGDATRMQIAVHGARAAEPPAEGAFGSDFAVRYVNGTDVSQERYTITNGREVREAIRAYVMDFEVRPLRAGEVTLPSVDVHAGGKTLKTRPVRMTVVGPKEARSARVELTLPKDTVFVEQPVQLVLRVLVRQARLDEGAFDEDPWDPRRPLHLFIPWFRRLDGFAGPDFERWRSSLVARSGGFRVNDEAESSIWGEQTLRFGLPRRERRIAGRPWYEYELTKTLVPTRTGTFEIPATTLRGEVLTEVRSEGRSLVKAGVEDVFVAHEPVTLKVLPIPAQGRPPTYSHAVGLYEAFAQLEPARGKVGDPMRLALTVQGSGMLDNVLAPRLSAQESLVRDFAVTESTEPSETEGGVKTFHFVVRPRRADVTELPPLEVAFFDPRTEAFEVARTEPIAVEVEEAVAVGASEVVQSGGAPDVASTPGEEVAGGILGNASVEETLVDESVRPLSSPLLLLLLFAPPLLLVVAGVVAVRARRDSGDPAALRERNALATARAALDDAARHAAAGDEASAVAALHRALAGYVADRSRVPAAGMTGADARARFDASDVDTPAAAALVEALEACEAARYGGGGSGLAERIAAAGEWLLELERERLR